MVGDRSVGRTIKRLNSHNNTQLLADESSKEAMRTLLFGPCMTYYVPNNYVSARVRVLASNSFARMRAGTPPHAYYLNSGGAAALDSLSFSVSGLIVSAHLTREANLGLAMPPPRLRPFWTPPSPRPPL